MRLSLEHHASGGGCVAQFLAVNSDRVRRADQVVGWLLRRAFALGSGPVVASLVARLGGAFWSLAVGWHIGLLVVVRGQLMASGPRQASVRAPGQNSRVLLAACGLNQRAEQGRFVARLRMPLNAHNEGSAI